HAVQIIDRSCQTAAAQVLPHSIHGRRREIMVLSRDEPVSKYLPWRLRRRQLAQRLLFPQQLGHVRHLLIACRTDARRSAARGCTGNKKRRHAPTILLLPIREGMVVALCARNSESQKNADVCA